MKTTGQIRKEIASLRTQIESLEKELKTAFAIPSEAEPGDILEDGSIVVERNRNSILVVAPESIQVRSEWSETFSDIFIYLQDEEGFNPSQWFVPSVEQLRTAFFSKARMKFSKCLYWASDYPKAHFDFELGTADSPVIRGVTHALVRPFRLIHF